jgi:hypothetical protein
MGGLSMENQLKELFGAWIKAVGSVTSEITQSKESMEMNSQKIN